MKTLLIILLSTTVYTCDAQVIKSKKPSAAVESQNQPDFNVALNFINAYIKRGLTNDKKQPPTATWIKTNTLLTPTFKAKYKALYDAADPEFGLEIDPILSAQDLPEKGFVISKKDPLQGYVIVSGIGWSDFKVIMKVVQLGNKWLVDGSGIVNIPKNKQIVP